MQLLSFSLDDLPGAFAAVTGVALAKLGGLYFLHKYGMKNFIWCGKVSKLFIYPLKSCRGIEVDEVTVTRDGMQYGPVNDRSYMIISNDGVMVSQRSLENIALMRQRVQNDKLVISAPGMEDLELDTEVNMEKERITEAVLFGYRMPVFDCGEEAHRWICKFLEKDNLRIVHLPKGMESVELSQFNDGKKYFARDGDVKKLHDQAPYMILNKSSIDDLANKIPEQQIDVYRFRPNILVEGSDAFDEDNWKLIQIGENNHFTRITMCSRCIFTTVDQHQPNKAKDSLEPLKTLRTYRLAPEQMGYGRSPIFGVHTTPDVVGGKLRVGDDVFAVKEHY